MSQLSFSDAKKLTLDRLRQWLNSLPESEKYRPRKIIDFKSYSVNDMIVEVEKESETGKKIVFDEMKQLGYVVT